MCLYLQEIDTPLIKVNAAYSSSSGYDAKRHDEKDDGVISHATSEFDLTMTIRHMSQEEALAPLRMTQLQTNYITKTMVRKSYAASSSSSNSNIGHYKRQKTETLEHANNNRSSRHSNTDDSDSGDNNEDEGAYYEEHEECYGGSTSFSDDNDDDDDSVSSMPTLTTSLALLPRPSFDILNELETHSKTIQLVASAGGLITHWNDAFAIMMIKSEYFSSSSSFSIKSFNPIGSSSGQLHHPPLTIFDLVESHSVPLLYSMLAMSLHNVPIVEVACFRPSDHYYNCYSDDYNISPVVHKKTTKRSSIKNDSSSSSSSSHLSITLPCKAFYNSSTLYNITIILMDSGYADGASQRCFLGILTPIIITTPTHEPTGVIEHKEEDDAVAMMVTQEQQQHCQDGPCPYYPKFAFGKVLCIDDKFLCQLLLGSK